ncbi:MAG: AIR synthase related protein, partial [Acidobacteriaceae bacterium]
QGPGGEAGVMRIKGTNRGLAMALAGNSRWCYLDPKLGAMHAVSEAARKVACTGATPVAATNCLNFGNPEKPEIMAQLSAAIDGIAEACTALGTPITGGNVSLYNETKGEGIYPTPVLGVVGIIDDVSKAVPADFQEEGDAILLLSGVTMVVPAANLRGFGSSEFAKTLVGRQWGWPPPLNLEGDESVLQTFLIRMCREGFLHSACDVSDGGIAVAIARATFANRIGADIDLNDIESQPIRSLRTPLSDPSTPTAVVLFAEYSSQAIVTCDSSQADRICKEFGLAGTRIGATGGNTLSLRYRDAVISTPISELKQSWSSSLESMLHDQTAAEVLA